MEQKDPSLIAVEKSTLCGEITIPPSKSHTLRAILFGALGRGQTRIVNPLPSPDTEAMIGACRLLGASITASPQEILIEGTGGEISHAEDVIDSGNSGLVLRLCSAIGSLSSHPIVVTGDPSIRHLRPMAPLLAGLSQLGVRTLSMRGDGYAPVILHGPLIGGKARILGTDSQPVSALLIAGSFAPHPTELIVDQPGETPWVDLTLHWLQRLGAHISHHNFSHYSLKGNLRYEGFEYTVPGDLSSAAYPLGAALITDSELLLHNVDLTDIQGDKEAIFLLQKMGAQLEIDPAHKTLLVKRGSCLKGITADINPTIDAIPLLAVVACYAQGETHLYNGSIARHKECNRLASITTELSKMGALISETHDGLKIQGAPLQGADLHSYHDHRLALSLCVAALGASGTTLISPWGCTAKTFPSFLHSLRRLGARLT